MLCSFRIVEYWCVIHVAFRVLYARSFRTLTFDLYMADDNDQLPDQEEGIEEAPATGGLKRRLPAIAAIIVGLAIGGGTGAALVGPVVVKKLGLVPSAHAADSASAEHDSTAIEEGAEGEKGKEGASTAPAVHLLENLVLNPAGSGGSRFLLMSVAIECSTAKGVEDLSSRDAELRDIILTSLGNKTVEQLTDVMNREGLKTEIMTAVAERFGAKTVKRLYFPQFVVQ